MNKPKITIERRTVTNLTYAIGTSRHIVITVEDIDDDVFRSGVTDAEIIEAIADAFKAETEGEQK